jgi:NAD(P)H-hydrate repair Nnr-like enzyme with NAD(P)H-hydrate dehydratase domain
MGRVAVIGGSEDYTGAPYFSAMATAKLGADMVSSIAILALSSRPDTKPRAM